MDPLTIGQTIRKLRTQRALTQHKLAAALGVTSQAVSKWECGLGCPDVSLLPPLAKLLGTSIETLLAPPSAAQTQTASSMHSTAFFACPQCGSFFSAPKQAAVSCCGKPLPPLAHQKADETHKLQLEPVEDEWFVTASHPMEKGHYISHAALVTGDQVLIIRRWPEWDFQIRLPRRGHGVLYWHCTKHGLFRQII